MDHHYYLLALAASASCIYLKGLIRMAIHLLAGISEVQKPCDYSPELQLFVNIIVVALLFLVIIKSVEVYFRINFNRNEVG